MSSSASQARGVRAGRRRLGERCLVWNRRLHYFIGLYLLFFCWLFAFTGLLLNHPTWEFARFWPDRLQTRTEQRFRPPEGENDLARARDLMAQLHLTGEIEWPSARPADGPFSFKVNRPGHLVDVKADLEAGRVTLQRTDVNGWGVMQSLHTFTGARTADPANQRDWWVTTAWALSMDAVAAGLVLMVLSSYVMWFRLEAKRRGGVVALALGSVSCALFVAGLRWLA